VEAISSGGLTGPIKARGSLHPVLAGSADPMTARTENMTCVGGRYAESRLLKRDRGVSTFLGSDVETGRQVVIKTAAAVEVSPGTQVRLEHEAELLAGLRSPFLAPVLAAGCEDNELYVVRPFVEGITLAERIRRGPLSTREALIVGQGVMRGLRAAHEHGVLHRDLKPLNVIVAASTPLADVTLVDLGSALRRRFEVSIAELPVGDAKYVSPEQAGLLHRDVDERSDLYSAGVLLFECLTGRPPFLGGSVGDLLREHVTGEPPSLRGLISGVPSALDELVQRLLRKDPRDRYQSAEAACHDLREIGEALAAGDADPAIVLGRHERRRRTLTEPAFIARASELGLLERELDRAAADASSLVLLEAQSGGGKSRLLDELERSSAQRGVWVLRGHGREQAAQRPLQMLEGLIGAVAARCRSDEAFAGGLRTRLAGREEALVEALPELASVLGGVTGHRSQGGEEHGEIRTIRALADLLDSLGSSDRAAVVMLDDCQWADELTLKLLAYWRGHARDRRTYAMVVVAFRTEEVAAEHLLRRLDAAVRVELAPLDPEAVGDLVESMAGVVPAEAIELVAKLSNGSPFMAGELVRGMVETGALMAGDAGWRTTPQLMAGVQASSRSAAVFGRRLEQAPGEVLELLSVGAVLGKQFDPDLAAELAGQSRLQAISALADARRRHIVWADDAGEYCAFVHDKLRGALLERLPEERRRALHRAAATSLEQRDASSWFELAYHFDAAGEHERALPYAIHAAATARSRYALDVAQRQYEIAARGATRPALQREIAEGLGDVAMLRGRYDEAGRHFAAARHLCDSDLLAAAIEGKLGELAFKRGDVRNSSELQVRALRLLGQRVPRRTIGFLVMLVWQLLVQVAHCIAPRLFVGRGTPEGADRERLVMRLHSELAHAYWFSSGLVPCAWSHLRGMNLAERYRPTPELAQAYSEHAPATTMVPWCSRGIAYAEKSLSIRRDLGDSWGEGQSLNFYGVVLYAAGRFEDVLEKCYAAVEILERTGDQWEVNTASWNIALALYRLGRMEEAIATAQRVHSAGVALGDDQASGISVGAWAKASGGKVPPALIEAELEHTGDDGHTRVEVLQAQALRHLDEGRIPEAVEVLEGADAYLRRSGLRQEYVAPVRPWLATALRLQLERTSILAPAERRRLARRARRVARSARRLAFFYRNNLPHALRESALLAAMKGRSRRALRLLERSLAVATEQGARHERAQTLLARGTLHLALGRPGAQDDLEEGQRALAELEPMSPIERAPPPTAVPEVTLSLADRFATVLDAGRRVASALTDEAIFAAVREAAVTLLRGECCAVIGLDEGGGRPRRVVAGDPGVDPSPAVIERARRNRRTVVLSEDDLRTDASASHELSPIRSALCAPIFVRGHATSCLYVTHSQLGGLFGEEESRLATFIAALAGAALENADGFSEVQALTASLEQRVAERTAELSASKDGVEAALSLLAATLDCTADGILVVNAEGKLVNYNRKFAEMWRIPNEVLTAGDDERAIAFVLEQLCDPEQFLSKLRELYAQPETESNDELKFNDGRTYERISKPHRLGSESVGRVWSFRDVTEQKRVEQDLQRLADHDELTGLFNRRRFEDELARAVAFAARYGGGVAALVLDLDNFKYVNDTLGHKAGDDVIQSVVGILRERVRETDVLARLGGDEFAVILTSIDAEGAQTVAADLLKTLRQHKVWTNGQCVSMTASIGVALLQNPDPSGGQLMVDADLAMYEAKRSGRDRISFYSAARAQQARVQARYTWGERIRTALERDTFVLHAQPILDLASGEISQYELLLRMQGDDGSLFVPGTFLPSAERLGLIQSIDRWVVRHAIQLIASQARTGNGVRLEVNLSGKSIGDRELTALIEQEITTHGIDPASLIFEVTETSAIANMEAARDFAETLVKLGCSFALDDFGIGFGSLYHLKHLPVRYLKIDGDFIASLTTNETDQLMVKTIVQIARGMGKMTIAECVCDAATQLLLSDYGVDFAQGYHVGCPVPVAELWPARARRDFLDDRSGLEVRERAGGSDVIGPGRPRRYP
jgi:diguanylate cyclase (GGDEF)-like protein